MKINNTEWTIKEVESLDSNLFLDNKICFGVCNHAYHTIYIDKNLNRSSKFNTLVHELTHAYIYSYLLSKPESYTEEELCQFVSHYAARILQDTELYIIKGVK